MDWARVYECVEEENGNLVDYLLQIPQDQWGAYDETGYSFIHIATVYECMDAIQVLFNYVNYPTLIGGTTPLGIAMHGNALSCARLLIKLGANVNIFRVSSESSLLEYHDFYTCDPIIRLLLANGANIHWSKETKKVWLARSALKECRQATMAVLFSLKKRKQRIGCKYMARYIGKCISQTYLEWPIPNRGYFDYLISLYFFQ